MNSIEREELVEILKQFNNDNERMYPLDKLADAILSKYIRKDSLPSVEEIHKVMHEHRFALDIDIAKAIKTLLEEQP